MPREYLQRNTKFKNKEGQYIMKDLDFKIIIIVAACIISTILMFVFGFQSVRNHAISLEESVESAKSDINIQEKRRVDLVYNLADCVKQYDKHEYETLIEVVDARTKDVNTDIENVSTMISATAEAYPDLKSNENYKELMNELSITENLIAEYRSNYNKQIKEYNRYIRKFPNNSILGMLGYEKQQYKYLEYDAPETAPQDLFKD